MAARPNAPRRPHQLTCPQIVSRDRGSVVIEINNHPVERSFQGVLTVAAEVGWLFPFSFQFFTRLAAVLAEEVNQPL